MMAKRMIIKFCKSLRLSVSWKICTQEQRSRIDRMSVFAPSPGGGRAALTCKV
jgi:hypothetical protein